MTTDYRARIQTILGGRFAGDRLSIDYKWNTIEEARCLLGDLHQKQKELRLLKKEISANMKEIRLSYRMQNSNVQAGFWATLAGRRNAGRDRAMKRDDLKYQQKQALGIHETYAEVIDQALVQLDRIKLDIDRWLMEHR